MKRRNFLKALPAAALTLAGCGQHKTAPANTASLVFDHSYPLDYATQFSADCYEGGYVMIDIPDAGRFLVVPEGAAEVDDLPEDVVVLRQPLDHIYLVSTSVMDLFVHLDALDSIALSGTKAEGWYVEEARQAMQEGRIAYAGKYSAPDYERILAAGCTLAIENTMVLHDPEVKEQLEKFGVPVLVERSSYENGPLARMEWLKLYGILLNKTEMAEEVFRQKVEQEMCIRDSLPGADAGVQPHARPADPGRGGLHRRRCHHGWHGHLDAPFQHPAHPGRQGVPFRPEAQEQLSIKNAPQAALDERPAGHFMLSGSFRVCFQQRVGVILVLGVFDGDFKLRVGVVMMQVLAQPGGEFL